MGGPRRTGPRRRGHGDAGAIVVGWLLRITVALVVVSVSLFDLIAVGLNPLQADDQAATAARAAQLSWQTSKDPGVVLSSARTAVSGGAGEVVVADDGVQFDAKGRITVTVTRTAHTLVLGRIARHVTSLQHYLEAQGMASAS
ncbi:MAG: hypothetical protein U0Q15_02980 [Kineosporiaceae bacterium]